MSFAPNNNNEAASICLTAKIKQPFAISDELPPPIHHSNHSNQKQQQ